MGRTKYAATSQTMSSITKMRISLRFRRGTGIDPEVEDVICLVPPREKALTAPLYPVPAPS